MQPLEVPLAVYTRAEDAVEKSVNLKLPNNVTQRPTVSSMAAEAKPGWSSAPWRPKKEIRVPVVGRRPLRHQVEGKAANDDSVSDLIAQSSVGSASASSWLGLKKSSEAARAVQPGDSARPFFAEAVPDSTPLSLRAALERKKPTTPHGPAGTTTYAMHLRSAEARHQREELRRAQGPTAHAEERFDGCAGLATKLGAMTRTPQGRVIAWDDKPVVNNGRKNVESTTEYWEELPAGRKHYPGMDVYDRTPDGRVLSWPEAADAASVRPTASYKTVHERQYDRSPPPRDDAKDAALAATRAHRTAMARKLGAISRTPPGRVIGWLPSE